MRERQFREIGLTIDSKRLEAAGYAASKAIYAAALEYAGPMPGESVLLHEQWRLRVDAFEWMVARVLLRRAER